MEALTTVAASSTGVLYGLRVALIGKLAGMSRRDAQRLIRLHGGACSERADAAAQLIVVGEEEMPPGGIAGARQLLDEATRQAVLRGEIELITETQLWQ